jgi:D-amino peptidase
VSVKIYVVCDIEGAAGVIDHRQQCWEDGHYYEQARRLATLELNALVEGALEGEAKEIVAWDGHCLFPGSVDPEILHPECKLVMGAGNGGPAGLDDSYHALFQCGLHAMSGTAKALMCHGGWELNGRRIGEIGASALLAGNHGIPFVFLSGDRAAAEEAKDLVPDVELAVVKEGLSPQVTGLSQAAAISLSPQKARQIIKEGAKRAMGKISKINPLRFDPPYVLRWKFQTTKGADDMMGALPHATRLDPVTLEFKSEDFAGLPL